MTEDYGARLAREWTERQDRMARTLYEETAAAARRSDVADWEPLLDDTGPTAPPPSALPG